jgi:hypothetical protein
MASPISQGKITHNTALTTTQAQRVVDSSSGMTNNTDLRQIKLNYLQLNKRQTG